MKNLDVKYLAGGPIEDVRPLPPYDERVCAFLADLSKTLRKSREAAAYPDILSFAFFCRKGNIDRLKADHEDGKLRLGRGLAFHIAPSNVPVNCAFTYVFGLLAGNANVVRVSSKDFEQVRIICAAMEELFATGKYDAVRDRTAFVSYGRDKAINDALSAMADVRVIWGGNGTIVQLRQSPIQPRCIEVTFADRYSFGLLDPEAVADASEEEVARLAGQFYNDTYLMDQNACSTPHLIVWKTNGGEKSEAGKRRFWNAVYQEAGKYDLADIKVSDKYVMLCQYAIDEAALRGVERWDNLLYVLTLDRLPENITGLRGKFGLFFQYDVKDLSELAPCIDRTVQTCVCYGVDQQEVRRFVQAYGLRGIDRVVSVGSALDIGVFWDGYDLVRQFSRIIGE